ncbi:hypothetical protein CEXT_11951 [Caerostris extrusa]|uniref:Uncharacterized protein n=1 Tax=Caerostris extrusa TaxID=172846 RepID=A0AAV4UW36_CAEEX|nr:hypothetical protein CEXT_11951 [Caerostris extrusa]
MIFVGSVLPELQLTTPGMLRAALEVCGLIWKALTSMGRGLGCLAKGGSCPPALEIILSTPSENPLVLGIKAGSRQTRDKWCQLAYPQGIDLFSLLFED